MEETKTEGKEATFGKEKGKYYMFLMNGTLEEIKDAQEVNITSFPERKFIIHPSYSDQSKWTVTDADSGMAVIMNKDNRHTLLNELEKLFSAPEARQMFAQEAKVIETLTALMPVVES